METVRHEQIEESVHKRKRKPWVKWLLIVLAVVIVVVISLLIYVNAYVNRSLPELEGEQALAGLQSDVTVIRDDAGVPHISAETNEDLFYAQGYVTAQDRLFQMEMSRRQASGRLSEVAGEAALTQDKYFRTLGLRRAAEASLELYDDEAIAALEAYAEGVNAYINEAHDENKWPVEFKIMDLDSMEDWSIVDSLTIGKYMAYDLGGNWERQAFNYYLLNHFDEDEAFELFPSYPEGAMTNISDEEYVDLTQSLVHAPKTHEFNGSNNWVVSGEKTESGKPLLANDPHLGLATPSIWYQVRLESADYNVSGVIFAGVPGIILGHNEQIAWGVTNVNPDVQQLFIEKRNENNPYQFLYDDEWVDAEVIQETIHVKDGESVDFEIVETIHGPIISEFTNEIDTDKPDTAFSVDWTALDPTTELSAILRINRASNWEEFEEALEYFHAPAQNFVFASQDGTIAYKANGKIPKYQHSDDALLPLPGWDSSNDLNEYIPFDELPTLINPEKGFVATANNKVITDEYPYHISHVWAQPYRYTRIHDVLDEANQLSTEDMMDLQMDQMNLQAEWLVPIMAEVLEGQELSDDEEVALNLLNEWDYIDHVDSPQPLIFHEFFDEMEEQLFPEYIPEEIYRMFKGRGQTVDQLVRSAYNEEGSIWFDKNGGLEAVFKNAFEESVRELKNLYGSDIEGWAWGDYHQVYFEHPLSNIFFLDKFFNSKEPVSVGGSQVTVMAASFKDDGTVNHGASWRFIIDLEEIEKSYQIVGPGQAGHYRSEWYDNQVLDWVNGDYHLTNMEESNGKKLILKAE